MNEVDARLSEKERQLQALRADAAEVEKHLSARITERELQLAEKHWLVKGSDREIARLKASVSSFTEKVGRLESAARDAEAKWRAGENRIGDEIIQKRRALAEQAAKANNVEQSLLAQIQALQYQCAAHQQLLQKREHTLERVKFEVAALAARLAQGKATILAERPAVGQEAKLARQTF